MRAPRGSAAGGSFTQLDHCSTPTRVEKGELAAALQRTWRFVAGDALLALDAARARVGDLSRAVDTVVVRVEPEDMPAPGAPEFRDLIRAPEARRAASGSMRGAVGGRVDGGV